MKLKSILPVIALLVVVSSCRRENDSFSINAVKEWFVPFSAKYSSPAAPGRSDSGIAHIILYEDSSLRYDFRITNLKSGDAMTGVTLNAGDPITNGPVLVDLRPRISSNYVTGGAFHLSPTLMDSLLNNAPIYLNVTSTQNTGGLVRGQLNSTIALAADVVLTGAEEVPPVTTTTTGLAVIRITTDKTVYSKITVDNLGNDQANMAHIHFGPRGVNGPIIVPLAMAPSDFNVNKSIQIPDAKYDSVMTLPTYVNVHTVSNPAGKVRGQLRN